MYHMNFPGTSKQSCSAKRTTSLKLVLSLKNKIFINSSKKNNNITVYPEDAESLYSLKLNHLIFCHYTFISWITSAFLSPHECLTKYSIQSCIRLYTDSPIFWTRFAYLLINTSVSDSVWTNTYCTSGSCNKHIVFRYSNRHTLLTLPADYYKNNIPCAPQKGIIINFHKFLKTKWNKRCYKL